MDLGAIGRGAERGRKVQGQGEEPSLEFTMVQVRGQGRGERTVNDSA